ncbi:response regulator [Lachnoclostridium sp. Marseille-P6806]|uniref:response regulator n=1 Tax=Lachnoclostridium sp. Marseille-P6806 TaxID=2364793 RepID=UPI0010320D2C|nr:response regulator [Lachnoclostridium sp. Marseille-P6806]
MKKVMIVDDNYISVEGIAAGIDWAELNALVTFKENDGCSAVRDMKKDPVDLIISDIEMPQMDGIEMCRQALIINPQVKILLISAFDKFEYAKRAIRIGVYDYIEKPVDYAYLRKKIENALRIMDQEDRNRRIIEQSRPVLMEKFLIDLVTNAGDKVQDHLGQYADFLNIRTDYSHYNVIKIEIANAADIEKVYGVMQYQMEILGTIDRLKEQCSIYNWFCWTTRYNEIVCYIGQNTNNPIHFLQVIHKCSEDILAFSSRTLLDINIGIGTIVDSIWKMHVSYENASNALKYRFCFPHESIYDSNDIDKHSFSLTLDSDRTEDELILLLGNKDEEKIKKWLGGYYNDLLTTSATKGILFTRTYNLVGKVLRFLYELNMDSTDLENDIAGLYSEFDKFDTYQQLYSWTCEFCRKVCQKMDTSTYSYHAQICQKVSSFIEHNFMDNTLSLADIARDAGVSKAYLSALYKKLTGQNINDTIYSFRIQKACQLLAGSELPLKDIATQCGYSNQYYFSNSFKKNIGKSPSAYREEHKR